MRYLLFIFIFVGFLGCAQIAIHKQMSISDTLRTEIELGMVRTDFIQKTELAGVDYEGRLGKKPERFLKDGKKYHIYFLRTSFQSDGLVTDDEFTPHIFENDKLVGIGWTYLGGPATQGQSRDTHITNVTVQGNN